MPIITIASTKGGVGKSTFTINLATAIQSTGAKVAVLDADTQNTVSKWNKIREYMRSQGETLNSIFVASATGDTLLEIANDKKNQGYIVLIDSPGVDDKNMRASLLRSDYVITVCPPSPVDLWEVETLVSILKKLAAMQSRKVPLILLYNKVPYNHPATSIEHANKFLDSNNITPDYILKTSIKERASFKHSIKDGRGVIEYSPADAKAIEEINSCFQEITQIIKKMDLNKV
jgi:chromosome partitioning protein